MQWYSLTQPPTHNLQHPYWLWIALGSFPSETLVKFKSWKVMMDWEGEGFVFFYRSHFLEKAFPREGMAFPREGISLSLGLIFSWLLASYAPNTYNYT